MKNTNQKHINNLFQNHEIRIVSENYYYTKYIQMILRNKLKFKKLK